MNEKSKRIVECELGSGRDCQTMYEVYDKITGEAVTSKSDGQPVRTTSMTAARIFIAAYHEPENFLHAAVYDKNAIPAGAELDVRAVRGES